MKKKKRRLSKVEEELKNVSNPLKAVDTISEINKSAATASQKERVKNKTQKTTKQKKDTLSVKSQVHETSSRRGTVKGMEDSMNTNAKKEQMEMMQQQMQMMQ